VTRTRVGRAAASLWLAAAHVVTSATPSGAALRGSGSSPARTISTATWRLDARATATGSPTGGPLTVSGLSTKHILYFSILNFGTVDLRGMTFAVNVTKGNNTTVVASFAICSGTWDEVADTCSGVETLLFSAPWSPTTPVSAPVTLTLAAGANVRIQADSNLPGTTVVVSMSVTSGAAANQIRTATTTAS
jgi:hypothetical protein